MRFMCYCWRSSNYVIEFIDGEVPSYIVSFKINALEYKHIGEYRSLTDAILAAEEDQT